MVLPCRFLTRVAVPLTPKQSQCVALLLSGMRQKDVADSLGIAPKTIQRWHKLPEFAEALELGQGQVNISTSEILRDTLSQRDRLREKELALLDRMEEKLLSYIDSDGLGYRIAGLVQSVVKISERRSKLLGLDIRSMSILDAVELLLKEQILSASQAGIVFEGVETITDNLRSAETQKESSLEPLTQE